MRKRYTLESETDVPQPFQNAAEVLAAADRNDDGIAEDDITIVGRVPVTQTRFEDATVFQDVDVTSDFFDANAVHYFYAVVPVDAIGIMGTPHLAPNSITPAFDSGNAAPAFFIETQPRGIGVWQVAVRSTHELQNAPILDVENPNGQRQAIFLTPEIPMKWVGTLTTDGFPPTGTYLYQIRGETSAGVSGSRIWQGRTFNYVANDATRSVTVAPNPLYAGQSGHLQFYPRGLTVEIYDAQGTLIKVLDSASEWDCTNQRGEMVCTGLYFFRATDENGFVKTGKFCIIK